MATSSPSKTKRSASKPTAAAKKSASSKTSSSAAGINNYQTALRWLYNHTDYERMRIVPYNTRTFNLERMRKLLGYLDSPHEELKCVQVAGTKGKGSTCAMLASMLQACGYTVGLYTSPHLVDLRERIQINGQMISHG